MLLNTKTMQRGDIHFQNLCLDLSAMEVTGI